MKERNVLFVPLVLFLILLPATAAMPQESYRTNADARNENIEKERLELERKKLALEERKLEIEESLSNSYR